jgi:hypothetical protein
MFVINITSFTTALDLKLQRVAASCFSRDAVADPVPAQVDVGCLIPVANNASMIGANDFALAHCRSEFASELRLFTT